MLGWLVKLATSYIRRISFVMDQNAGEKALILQVSNAAVSDTLFDSSHAQRPQNQSGYAEVVCRLDPRQTSV
jgi:hypothetical protein